MSIYGYCPACGAEGIERERRIDGNDTCKNGHKYPSEDSLREPKFKLNFANEDELIAWLEQNIKLSLKKDIFIGAYGEREYTVQAVVKYKDVEIKRDFYGV